MPAVPLLRPERLCAALTCLGLMLAVSWGQGVLTHDEHRVRGSIPWRALAQGEISEAAYNAFDFSYARPGLVVAYAPAGVASWVLGAPRPAVDPANAWELDPVDVRCAMVMTAVWAALGVLWAGRLGERLGGRSAGALASWWLALSVVVLHQGRTLFPTVVALALGAAFLERYVRARQGDDERATLQAGLLLSALCLTYPGAYPLGVVLLVDLAQRRAEARRRAGVVAFSVLFSLLVVEILMRSSYGGSYMADLADLSTGIKIGDPREGWSYPLEYFWTLDRAVGVAVFLLAISAGWWGRTDAQRFCGWSALAIYAWSGLLVSTILGRQVLYGRLVGIWPALLIPLAASFPRGRRRRVLACVLLLGLHQAPGIYRLLTTPRPQHPGSLYEGLGPEERAAARG